MHVYPATRDADPWTRRERDVRDEGRWPEARELFLDLVEKSTSEREAALAAKSADATIVAWVRDLLAQDDATARPPEAPKRLGPYEIVRPIGRGGMGEVYVARRADGSFEREVAIKRLHSGLVNDEMIRRFLRERQTLARLDHEYVARLLDGGTTENGEPYLVMEYVEGEPADVYAARLGLRAKLELFERIVRAVTHAHERGFVHRDLKPSNVLVRADGAPRLLDFGIARLESGDRADGTPPVEPLTRTGNRLYTPEYASPEQIRGGEATTRSDVFALGVLLYEFLAGARPWKFEGDLYALERAICEDEPTPPSRRVAGTGRERVPADLDAVVLQCLAKRPDDRYASAAALGEDVQRFLDGRPVRARRVGVVERLARHARNRPAHAAVAALVVIVLAVAVVAWRGSVASERRRAELRAAVQDRIATALVHATKGEVDEADAEIDAASSALRELPGESALEAEVLSRKAVFAGARRNWAATRAHVDRAFELLDGASAPDPLLVARLLNSRAYALQMEKPGDESAEAYRAALEYTLAHVPRGDVLRVDALTGRAHEDRRAGRDDAWIRGLEDALAEARAIDDPRRQVLARALNEIAIALARLERFDEASEHYREALEILDWNHGESHPSFAVVRHNLGSTLFRGGRAREAEEQFERSLAVSRATGREELIASNQVYVARLRLDRGDFEAAAAAAREAFELFERNGPAAAARQARGWLGVATARLGRADEARVLLAPLAADDADLPPDLAAEVRHRLGAILDDAGERDAARPLLESALATKRASLGAAHADCAEIERRLSTTR